MEALAYLVVVIVILFLLIKDWETALIICSCLGIFIISRIRKKRKDLRQGELQKRNAQNVDSNAGDVLLTDQDPTGNFAGEEAERIETPPEFIPLPSDVKPFLGIDRAHVVKENENSVTYKVEPQFRPAVTQMILSINPILQRSAILVPTFEPNTIMADDIVFDPFVEKYAPNLKLDLTVEAYQPAIEIEELVYTPLGNVKKFPFKIHFFTRRKRYYDASGVGLVNEVFGRLFFDKNGELSRIEIVHWKGRALHQIYCTKDSDSNLTVSQIKQTDKNGATFNKYKRD